MTLITINSEVLEKKDQLKLRMLRAKSGLPTKGYAALFRYYYPEDKYTALQLSQVWTCRLMDQDIIEKFETIHDCLRKE